jgi:predicted nuclease of predicted toxin-antitoxin system
MRLLLDQGLPRTGAQLLREAGIDTVHVGEIGFSTAADADILAAAQRENRVVVTLDADFHSLLAHSGAAAPSVIRIRIEGLRADRLTELLRTVCAQCDVELEQGAVVTVQPGRIRIHRLPLLGQG